MRFKPIIALSALALATACAPVDPGFGEAVRYDMAIQTINPDPVYPEGSAEPGASGVKAADAVKRYRTDAVKAVESPTSGSTGSSGSGPQ